MKKQLCFAMILACLLAMSVVTSAFAGSGDVAIFGGCMTFIVIMIILNIAFLVWLVRDVKARGGDNPVVWLIATLLFGPLAIIVYLLARNKGEIVKCQNCGNKKLISLVKCPHCGADRAPEVKSGL